MQQLPQPKTRGSVGEGAGGKSGGAKIIQARKLAGISQQGFLPI